MGKKHILIVDDDKTLVKCLKPLLTFQGYIVQEAYNGLEALVALNRKDSPDLVILDRHLPDTDGLTICHKIRENRSLSHIAVIILSGLDKPAEKIEGLHTGADDYITKPFDNNILLARIEAVLRRYIFSQRNKEEIRSLLNELSTILSHGDILPYFQPVYSTKDVKPLGFHVTHRTSTDGVLNRTGLLYKAALAFGKATEFEILCWQKAVNEWKESDVDKNSQKLLCDCTPTFIENNLLDQSFCKHLGIEYDQIMLGLTELSAIRRQDVFDDNLREYKKRGAMIGIDDVGCYGINIKTIDDVAPNYIKISESLINGLQKDSFKNNFVKTIVNRCKERNIMTIAKGIETSDEFKSILDLGIDAMQGDFIGQPVQTAL